MSYALVENGVVTQIGLPQSGTLKDGSTVSGYNLLDTEVLATEGWLPFVDVIPSYDTQTQKIVQNGYTIKVNQVVKAYQIAPLFTLDEYKQRKIDELTNIRNDALETFISSALGTPHTYLSRASSIPNDMLLLTSEYSFASGAHFDNQPIPWYTEEEGNIMHTGTQIIQVYLDARASVQTKMLHCGTLVGLVSACTTIEQLNAVVW